MVSGAKYKWNQVYEYINSQCNVATPATETHMPYGITKWYLPPGRRDIPAFTAAETGTRFSKGCLAEFT